ncbi:GRB2-associated-binding protein 3 [Oryzias melastigma]|uniref:GRB2-associated-binding protein 3 n=1 Tax=Oryzias melastigma TaxID=30732 RepID=A0A834BSD2_ORYME|nr:GRB2-associated-binding protein 3 [Oryzias melastigma]
MLVCTGWLIKSPPEKKLKRFAWRKRWFVLRRGRMSGNPDVLEYYQSKNSKKPIRTIDLKECEVEMPDGQLRIKRDFHGKHLFVVKTCRGFSTCSPKQRRRCTAGSKASIRFAISGAGGGRELRGRISAHPHLHSAIT